MLTELAESIKKMIQSAARTWTRYQLWNVQPKR